MPTQLFSFGLWLEDGVWQDGSYSYNPLVDSGELSRLNPGDNLTAANGNGQYAAQNYTFNYATQGGGFVATNGSGTQVWFTNTYYDEGTTPTATSDGFYVICFLEGTLIQTPAGPLPVEALSEGDLVVTADGQTRPVRWMGQQTIVSLFADHQRSAPIRIQAGALGEGLPLRDLFVSPDHALMVDGLLVQAAAMVNGTSICQVAQPAARFTYFHIELADHALVLAEGVPAETFVDNVTRSRFDNYADYVARFGDAPGATGELDAPRVKSARQLPASLKARLAARAALLAPQRDAA